MLSQKEAVFNAITGFFGENDIAFDEGMKVELNKDQRAVVAEMVTAGITAGDVSFSELAKSNYETPENPYKVIPRRGPVS